MSRGKSLFSTISLPCVFRLLHVHHQIQKWHHLFPYNKQVNKGQWHSVSLAEKSAAPNANLRTCITELPPQNGPPHLQREHRTTRSSCRLHHTTSPSGIGEVIISTWVFKSLNTCSKNRNWKHQFTSKSNTLCSCVFPPPIGPSSVAGRSWVFCSSLEVWILCGLNTVLGADTILYHCSLQQIGMLLLVMFLLFKKKKMIVALTATCISKL